ncbi:hypothetical protein D3C86_1226610 [compost metagenome]
MIEGRRGQLDAAFGLHLGIGRNDRANQFPLLGDEQLAIRLREIPTSLDQGPEVGIALQPHGVEPAQVEPDREVEKLLRLEARGGLFGGHMRHQVVALGGELVVARVGLELIIPVQVEEALEKISLVVRRHPVNGLEGQLQRAVDGSVVAVVAKLLQERRDEVEGLADLGVLPQDLDHVEVILDGMESNPRH